MLEADRALSQKAREYLHSIREALERSVQITARLLPLSAPAAGVRTLRLAAAVRAALPALRPDFEKEGATIELDLEEAASVVINPEQLDFVVITLLVNARHAVMGQPVRRVTVSTGVSDGERRSSACRTPGSGLPRDKISSIFTPFFTEKGEHAAPQLSPGAGHGHRAQPLGGQFHCRRA